MPALILVAVLAVAFANGANANVKGVVALFGSGTTGYLDGGEVGRGYHRGRLLRGIVGSTMGRRTMKQA